jgi:WD40 repeat protein
MALGARKVQHGFGRSRPEGRVCVLETRTGRVLWEMRDLDWGPCGLALSPDGQHVLYSASSPETASESLYLRRLGSPEKMAEFAIRPHYGAGPAVCFSAKSDMVACAGRNGNVTVIDCETMRVLRTFSGHRGAATCVSFSDDGRFLASGSNDTTVLVWDLKDVRNR